MPYTVIKTILQLAAITTFVLGVAIIIVPQLIILWFEGYSPDNYHFVRFVGTALVGFAVTNWLYSKFHDLAAVLPAIYGNITSLGMAILTDLIGIGFGTLSRAAWLILALHIVFAAAFGYCVLLIKKTEAHRLKS